MGGEVLGLAAGEQQGGVLGAVAVAHPDAVVAGEDAAVVLELDQVEGVPGQDQQVDLMPAAAVVAELEVRPGAERRRVGSSCLTMSKPLLLVGELRLGTVTQRPSFTVESPLAAVCTDNLLTTRDVSGGKWAVLSGVCRCYPTMQGGCLAGLSGSLKEVLDYFGLYAGHPSDLVDGHSAGGHVGECVGHRRAVGGAACVGLRVKFGHPGVEPNVDLRQSVLGIQERSEGAVVRPFVRGAGGAPRCRLRASARFFLVDSVVRHSVQR